MGISSVAIAAINPAPKVKFSISKFKFRRNIGSTPVLRLWRLIPDSRFEVIFFMA